MGIKTWSHISDNKKLEEILNAIGYVESANIAGYGSVKELTLRTPSGPLRFVVNYDGVQVYQPEKKKQWLVEVGGEKLTFGTEEAAVKFLSHVAENVRPEPKEILV